MRQGVPLTHEPRRVPDEGGPEFGREVGNEPLEAEEHLEGNGDSLESPAREPGVPVCMRHGADHPFLPFVGDDSAYVRLVEHSLPGHKQLRILAAQRCVVRLECVPVVVHARLEALNKHITAGSPFLRLCERYYERLHALQQLHKGKE